MRTNVIYQLNCIEGMGTILDVNSIDIIITSPPYNIGLKYNSYLDDVSIDEYMKMMLEFGKLCRRVLKNDGSLFFNIGNKLAQEQIIFHAADKLSESLKLQNTIHWIKSIAVPEENINIGHFKPINSERYLNDLHEYIFHFTKDGDVKIDKMSIGVPYADKSNISRWQHGEAHGDKRDRGNVWYIPYDTVQDKKEHPAAFPEKLPEMCIKLHGYNNNTVVLDPFSGSGTTSLVARRLGCKWIGFEIDFTYVKMSREKLTQNILF